MKEDIFIRQPQLMYVRSLTQQFNAYLKWECTEPKAREERLAIARTNLEIALAFFRAERKKRWTQSPR